MDKRFSVIVPIYNVDNYLRQCIDSVLSQTYTDFELILVDDGSTDDSPNICDSYSYDSRVKIIHKQNEGLVKARQSGIKLASGDYVVCLDGDDWLHINFLKKMSDIIDSYKPDVICCGRINSDGKYEKHFPFSLDEGYYDRERIELEIFPFLIENRDGKYFPPSVWAKCFKRTIYEKYQLLVDGSIQIGEDMACTRPLISSCQSLYIIKEPLYYYRQNPASMTKAKKAFRWDGPIKIGQHLEKTMNMDEYDFMEQNYRFITHNLFLVAMSQFNRNESYSKIRQDILNHLSDPYYSNAIIKSKYNFLSKGTIARLCLKHKATSLIQFFNKIWN